MKAIRKQFLKNLRRKSNNLVNSFVDCWTKMMVKYYALKTQPTIQFLIPVVKYSVKLVVTYLIKVLLDALQKIIV